MNKKFKKIQLKLFKYKKYILSIGSIVKSFNDYALTGSPLSFAEGIFDASIRLLNLRIFSGFEEFNPSNNWYPLFSSPYLAKILGTTLQDLPSEVLEFEDSSAKLINIENMPIVVISDNWNNGNPLVLCGKENKEKILKILASKKLSTMEDSLLLELNEVDGDSLDLKIDAVPIKPLHSDNADELYLYLEKIYSKNINNRSILFWGLPGVGKTSISYSLVDKFKFRTLKFKPTESLSISTLLEIINLFDIKSVILDDMDRFYTDEKLLNFLDILNNKIKLTMGICNTLFALDPALMRPGRFDDVIKIEELDQSTIKGILKEIYEDYKEKVVGFPVAYIQELYKQYTVNPENLSIKFEELNDRVEKLKQLYCEREPSYNKKDLDEKDDNDDEEENNNLIKLKN